MTDARLNIIVDSSQAAAADKTLASLAKTGGVVEQSTNSLANTVQKLAAAYISFNTVQAGFRALLNTVTETERLRGALQTMTGSAENAGIAFDNLTKFAATTPFTLDQSVNAFIKLKALGLDPSERALTSYGNTASAMGKTMSQMIEAVADASTMQFERLKEFGIKAAQEGDNVSFTFQGVTTTVKKNADEIQNYLMAIGENKFGDAMANQMERLPGKLSNLEDAVSGFWRTIGDAGATNALSAGVDKAAATIQYLTNNLDEVKAVFGIGAAVMTAQYLPALVAANAGTLTLTGSAAALRVAMLALAGPAGVVGLAAGAMFLLVKHQKDVADAAWKDAMAFDAVRESLGKLTEQELTAHAMALNRDIEKTQASIREKQRLLATLGPLTDAHKSVTEQLRLLQVEETAQLSNQKLVIDQLRRVQAGWVPVTEAVEENTEATTENTRAVMTLDDVYRQASGALTITADEYVKLMGITEGVTVRQTRLSAGTKAVTVDMEMLGLAMGDTGAAATEAAEQTRRDWERTHDFLSETFVDIFDNGGSAFEKLGDAAVATAKRIVAEWLAMKAMNLFGIPAPGSVGGGGGAASSIIGSIGSSAIGRGVSNAVGGLLGIGGAGVAAGTAVGGTAGVSTVFAAGGASAAGLSTTALGAGGAAAGSGIGAAIAAVPGWGWALAGGAALAGLLAEDSTPSSNAGFLMKDVPGASADRKFDVAPFASGFDPVGFARRESQGSAVQIIDTFRAYDAALTEMARSVGYTVDYDWTNFAGMGTSETGQGAGVFVGSASEDGTLNSSAISSQVDQYVRLWIEGLGSQIGPNAKSQILAAGNADAMLAKAAELTAGVHGSHATGLSYVPFDGYRAELHQGERVQTASEARNSDSGMAAMAAKLDAVVAELRSIRGSTSGTYTMLRNLSPDGQSLQTVAA